MSSSVAGRVSPTIAKNRLDSVPPFAPMFAVTPPSKLGGGGPASPCVVPESGCCELFSPHVVLEVCTHTCAWSPVTVDTAMHCSSLWQSLCDVHDAAQYESPPSCAHTFPLGQSLSMTHAWHVPVPDASGFPLPFG